MARDDLKGYFQHCQRPCLVEGHSTKRERGSSASQGDVLRRQGEHFTSEVCEAETLSSRSVELEKKYI